ncbi:hypothetical protein CcaverHIS002_0411140 [Cutaneotrichosporon cavernicola]|uniref:Zn(2)-C6 fungal-type domain-containing protein n=1 Tax=Cutaneotrichosporon cavernicola TaxID=279322 RepID=A0AA48L5F7_9TREE|nr:uncharacterized protein CcaverHIS019_0411050 [Cutaneotrichosporon cavernicola]BEI84510.1 hypothetical protein CcaverHIS002_0411140 [Cutaneotrichosporon cavernicola]BEI92285.1 hypothetical protein CcaverHIS019_0411050 [Cutaneotrichosporon cavernicola]BEJ00057.1 hypothetical protein CcaverHIS631_0410990 [Cutaneotrichosporon cavernicola]BEJ07829.1 hypothetical protein CcaverHIS641_0410980 [Cutaneotrichosporon cavernicola]
MMVEHADGSPDSPNAPIQKRKRSRAGCYTCRRRKKACDNSRPVCGSCTRLGIPCVFPKLYRNAKGELVPSPQPNGRTKRLSRDSESPEIERGNALTSAVNPWDNAQAGWTAHSQPSVGSTTYLPDEGGDSGDNDVSDTALDAFLQSLNDNSGGDGQGWMLPLFADGALELDLNGGHPSAVAMQPPPFDHSPSAMQPPPPPNPTQPNFIASVLDHLPALYEYWVNSFSHVLSVLGPGHNPQVDNMFPVVQRSPLVMCALIAWAATHRANIGHPYEEVARLATEFTELQADQIDIERELTPNEREEYMWTLLILGGTEIVQGDVKGWVRRLPMTRRLLCKVVETIDFGTTITWQALAYNCAYHDILASLTTAKIPDFPYELYNRILTANDLEMDSYMGATRRIFQFLIEIAALAGKVSTIYAQPESPERDRALGRIVADALSMRARLDAADLPNGLFKHPLPVGTDRALLIVSFYTYKLAAELYLRQSVLRCGPSDLKNRRLGVRIINNIHQILGTPNESQMCFPLFLAGVATADAKGRAEVDRIFHKFSSRVQVRNVMAILNLLYEVWKRDPEGDRYVDWRKLAEEQMEVAYSFA